MSQKKQLLHELLQEDQEPFHLNDYIHERSCQLVRKDHQPKPKPYPSQLKKRNPLFSSSSSNFTCKNACFFAITSSPADPRRSPAAFLDLRSPGGNKSPSRRRASPVNGAVFLHVPAKTASILLEAALRIQKQSANASRPKSGSPARFGPFVSLLQRLNLKNNKNVKGVITSSPPLTSTSPPPTGLSSVRRSGRRTSTVWSGSSEEKDLDCFSSSSGSDSDDHEEITREVTENNISVEFVNGNYILERKNNDDQFCESPFRFALSTSPHSPGNRTPELSSPATSPSRQNIQDHEHNKVGGSLKFQVQREEYEEEENDAEEDKEQCSPVSVLDPPFEDDDEEEEDDDHMGEDDGFDRECSYAIVQRAQKQLLRKLRKFEKLAGLDPVELEKRMMEDNDDPRCGDDVFSGSEEEAECREKGVAEEDAECRGEGTALTDAEKNIDVFLMEELQVRKIPRDMKRLVSDMINEEGDNGLYANRELMSKRVCKRFESWKDVDSNTIDMMVEMDFKEDQDRWKRCREQVEETFLQIELGIFGSLMEELTEELVALTDI